MKVLLLVDAEDIAMRARHCRQILLLLVVLSGLWSAVWAPIVHAAVGPFCDERPAIDYSRPFERMPSVHRAPTMGRLPFGPSEVSLGHTRDSSIEPGGGRFGYMLSYRSRKAGPIRLDWEVMSRIVVVNGRGRATKVLGTSRRVIHLLQTTDLFNFGLSFTSRPSFYRYTFIIKRTNGKRLANYSQYFRVVPPSFKSELRTDVSTYHPGDTIALHVVNLGTEPILYDEAVGVQVLSGGSWELAPAFPPRPITRVARKLSAGGTGKCENILIPPSVPSGRYRLVKKVSAIDTRGQLRGQHRIMAEFNVAP